MTSQATGKRERRPWSLRDPGRAGGLDRLAAWKQVVWQQRPGRKWGGCWARTSQADGSQRNGRGTAVLASGCGVGWPQGGLGWGEVRRLGRAALRAGVARQDVREDRDPGRGAGKGVRDPGRSSMGASPCALDRGLQSPAGRPGVPQSPRCPQGPVGWPTASCLFPSWNQGGLLWDVSSASQKA